MEKRGSRLFLLVATGVTSFVLCSTSAAAVSLQLKLGKGKTYYQRTVMDQHLIQTVMGQDQVMDQSMGTGLKMDVLDVDRQGNMRIRNTFNWARSKQTNPMGSFDYDSAKQPTPPAGAEAFAALLGQSYVVTISPRGEVLDVNGVEEMQAAVRQKLPPGAQADPALSALAQYLNKKGIKEMTESTLGVYPDKPVDPGQSWSSKKVVTPAFELTIDSKWTLQKREAGVAIIGATSSMRSNPDTPIDAGGMKVRFDLAGTQDGTMRVEEATGLIRLADARQQLKGEIKVGDSPQGPPMMAIPVTFDTTIKLEMSDKPLEGTDK
jgi:hypothetical protein